MSDMTFEEFELWKFETQLIETLLAQVEQAEREILRHIGCPTDPVLIYKIIVGEQPAPWPKRNDKRDRERAKHAMYTLVHIKQTRHHLGLGSDNARRAAHEALFAGLFANDAAAKAVLAAQRTKGQRSGGRKRGAQLAREATKRDAKIKPYLRKWNMSDELQDQHTATAYIKKKLPALSTRTIQRGVRSLRSKNPRQ